MAAVAAPGIRWMRDPTRGGVATSLNELARDCGSAVSALRKNAFPCAIRCAARASCSGLDPLHIANEGQFLAVVAPESADAALAALQADAGWTGGRHHRRRCEKQPAATVLGNNGYGGTRVIDMLVGDPLPRIC